MSDLAGKLRDALSRIAGALFVGEKEVNELVKEIQRALLQADVNVQLVLELSNRIKSRVLKEKAPSVVSRREQAVHIVYEELVRLLGEKEIPLVLSGKPAKVMLLGLYGSGKTTQAGKLARYYQKRGHRVACVQLDVWRPAAYEQLSQLGAQCGVPVFGMPREKDPLAIYRAFSKEYPKYDILIVDTAGRDALSEELIREINALHKEVQPQQSLLVLSADMGQSALAQAKAFHEACGVTGVIITKMDGTAKGGGALAACSATGAKVMFLGTGEKPDDLEVYRPEGFVSRLLGMGDLQALLDKVQDAVSEEQAADLSKRFMKGDFTLIDLYEQMDAMSKMGPLSKVLEMVPGFSQLKLPKDTLTVQEGKLKLWKHAMNSMTREELDEPEVIDASRAARISKGSGVPPGEVRDLVRQYRQSKRLVRSLKGGNPKSMEKLMRRMGGGKGGLKFA